MEALQFPQVNSLAVLILWPPIENFLLADFTHLTHAFFHLKIWNSASQGAFLSCKTPIQSHLRIDNHLYLSSQHKPLAYSGLSSCLTLRTGLVRSLLHVPSSNACWRHTTRHGYLKQHAIQRNASILVMRIGKPMIKCCLSTEGSCF